MELSSGIRERVRENAFRLKFGLVLFSALLIIGGSTLFSTLPVWGGGLIFVGILLEIGVLWIYKVEIEAVQDEVETTQSEINRTKDEVEQTRDDVATAQTQIATTRDEVDATKEQVDTTRDRIADTKDEIEEMQDALYEKFGRYRSRESLEGRANELEDRIDDLEAQIEEVQDVIYSRRSAVTRQAIEEKLDHLEILDELVGESGLTRDEVDELAQRIDDRARERVVEDDPSSSMQDG